MDDRLSIDQLIGLFYDDVDFSLVRTQVKQTCFAAFKMELHRATIFFPPHTPRRCGSCKVFPIVDVLQCGDLVRGGLCEPGQHGAANVIELIVVECNFIRGPCKNYKDQ